jgi:hypothetical protein
MYVKDHNAAKFEPSAAYLFKYLLLANMIQYMEAGAVPALLLALSHSFSMQPGQVRYAVHTVSMKKVSTSNPSFFI